MKFISLFAGVGGFDLALERLGHECVYANDIDKYCKIIYDKYFKTKLDNRSITDVTTDEIPDHELLVGGFPCQSFSIAGKRRGFEDTRGTLFFDIARILKDKKPRLFILENVKGLLSHDSGNTLKTIITTLTELGYDLQWQVLNSKNFGVPQNRERVFIIGHIRGTRRPEVFPLNGNGMVCSNPAVTLTARGYGSQRNGTYVISHAKIRKLTEVECERLQGFPDNWTQGVSSTQRYKMIGNAVTINVVYEIAKRL